MADRSPAVISTTTARNIEKFAGLEAFNMSIQAAAELLRLSKEECPVSDRHYTDEDGKHPGALRDSHRMDYEGNYVWNISADTNYAIHVYDGNSPTGPRKPNRWLLRAIDRARL